MYFDFFPKTRFKYTNDESFLVTDFLRAIRIDPKLKEDDLFYDLYNCRDNETPEIISHRVYSTTQYHWVIMLLNEKFDPHNDFPKDDLTLQKLTIEKYGSLYGIHHYINSDGNWVDIFSNDKTPITNLDHERNLNEEKRLVKILKKEVLSNFIQQYKNLIAI